MTAFFVTALICLVVFEAVLGLTALLRWAERRYPRFSAFLDRHVGDEPDWMQPW